jgi:tetratricopeptide (TPR) repeat protein
VRSIILKEKSIKTILETYFYNMDAKTMLLHLQDNSKLKTTTTADWNNIIDKYPYFATAQMLKYASEVLDQKGDMSLIALYKQDPLFFAEWISTVGNLNISAEKPIAKIEIEAKEEISTQQEVVKETEPQVIKELKEETLIPIIEEVKVEEIKTAESEKDILELINELPNSNPIELNTTKLVEKVEKKEALKEDFNTIVPAFNDKTMSISPDKSLMVMMSFTDWLNYFKHKRENEQEEAQSKKALKTSWQKEKLTAAMEEDVDEIPEPIFQQAMDSITMESSMVSESLAKILASQGKVDKAIDMYKKLSLRFPEKRTYFADLIEKLNLKRD